MSEETRVIYHLEDQETPYLVRINVPAQRVTLRDFRQTLNLKPNQNQNLKFFFKNEDQDYGAAAVIGQDELQGSEVTPVASPPHRRDREEGASEVRVTRCRGRLNGHAHQSAKQNGAEPTGGGDSSSTQQSSQLETTSFCSSEEDSGGRFSQSTGHSSSSPRLVRRQRRRHRKPKTQRMERSVSFSSVTDSTMSLNVITVTLNMERYNFLGISIVGQSNDRGDGGIYIGSIMKGGAVAADGRIEPGDMLLQVNEINFENMSNDDAVRVLREIVHKPGPVTLTVAKCWDPNPRGCFTLPRSEPVRPIDPAAWVSHTAAMTGSLLPHYGVLEETHLSIHSDMTAVVKAMANRESGLEVRDRMWLKITIPNAFIGSDVVDWLHRNVEGFTDRREARKYAGNLLKAGFIRHTVNKVTFSEQCYYVFGDLSADLSVMSLLDHEDACSRGGGASDCDPLAPPPGLQWPPAFPYQYPPIPHPYSSPHPLPRCRPGGEEEEEEEKEEEVSTVKAVRAAAQTAVMKVRRMEEEEGANQSRPNRKRVLCRTNSWRRSLPATTAPNRQPPSLVSMVTEL
ncbi:LOW QUALITY PROTEIN: segment polarity protein dishevelled homolog DVL-3 [Symphorus nematophorus]